MRTVSVDGVVYTKAKEVADDFGYTADYLGQLCRAGKIECQLVGRAWYVSVDSVDTHRSNKQSLTGNPPIIPTADDKDRSASRESLDAVVAAVAVRPVLSKQAIRSLFQEHQQRSFSNYSAPTYVSDEADLLPRSKVVKGVSKSHAPSTLEQVNAPAITLKVVPSNNDGKESVPLSDSQSEEVAEAEVELVAPEVPTQPDIAEAVKMTALPIKQITRQRKLSFTPVPQVPLRGKIIVRQVEHEKPKILPRIPPSVVATDAPKKQTIKLTSAPIATRPPLEKNAPLPSARASRRAPKVGIEPLRPALKPTPALAPTTEKVTFSPSSVAKKQVSEIQSSKGLTLLQAVFLAAAIVALFALTLFSFFGGSRLEIDNTSGDAKNTLYLDFAL